MGLILMDIFRGKLSSKIGHHFDGFFCKSLINKKIRQTDGEFPVKIHPNQIDGYPKSNPFATLPIPLAFK